MKILKKFTFLLILLISSYFENSIAAVPEDFTLRADFMEESKEVIHQRMTRDFMFKMDSNVHLIKMLLELVPKDQIADFIMIRDDHGYSALHYAVIRNFKEIAEEFVNELFKNHKHPEDAYEYLYSFLNLRGKDIRVPSVIELAENYSPEILSMLKTLQESHWKDESEKRSFSGSFSKLYSYFQSKLTKRDLKKGTKLMQYERNPEFSKYEDLFKNLIELIPDEDQQEFIMLRYAGNSTILHLALRIPVFGHQGYKQVVQALVDYCKNKQISIPREIIPSLKEIGVKVKNKSNETTPELKLLSNPDESSSEDEFSEEIS